MPAIPSFVHLHNHTEYSLLDGLCRVTDLVQTAKDMGMNAVALTDHGNMFAVIPFYNQAKKTGIKPIIGCEVYLASRTRHDKEARIDNKPRHLVLLAKNLKGYQNLMCLVSIAFTEGFYYKPRVDYELLEKYHEGLVVLSACMQGPIAVKILEKDHEGAKKEAQHLQAIFGEDFYLEVQNQGIAGQLEIIEGMVKLNKELGIPLVATNDVHYIKKEDAYAQDVLLCVSTGKKLADSQRMSFTTREFFMKSPQEMYELFSYLPEALENTARIAEKCNLEIEQGINYLPSFIIPEGFTEASYLEKLTWEGLKKRYPEITEDIRKRVEYELEVINKMDFPAYFLIVADFIGYARSKGIAVGPGRGSAAGSIVAYSLEITNIDPLRYHLLFERFLNPERVSLPDIDIDFCIERRQEVIDYVAQKYGHDHVAQIITFGTMAARGVIRDVGRVLGIPLSEVDRIAKLIPGGPNVTITQSLKDVAEFNAYYKNNESIKNLIDTSLKLEGLSRHDSTHAAGVVISRFPLTEKVPVKVTSEGQLITQYAKDELEKIGLLKMDFLGLRNLTMIDNCLEIIKRTKGETLDLSHLPVDDVETYKLLARGDTSGVFQLESRGMKSILKDLKPSVFEDIIAMLALYRPGPIESGMIDDFVKRKHDRSKVKYLIPQLEPILKETYGTIIYQEQIMQIASVLGGFSLGEADVLRRAMGKKKMEEMEKQKEKFVAGAVSRGIDKNKAIEIFDLCANFAKYGFNKSHSAAYAIISYQTAYLKTHYPVEFMAALISSMVGSIEKVSFYIQECKAMGIEILVPDINESLTGFTVVGSNIRFGMGAIRNVGDSALESIVAERDKNGIYKSFYDLCKRVDLRVANKRVMESLIKAGAMDSFGGRKPMMEALEPYIQRVSREQRDKENGMVSLFGGASSDNGEKKDFLPDIPDYDQHEKMKMEKDILGLYISDHPLNHINLDLAEVEHDTTVSMKEKEEGEDVRLIGMVTLVKKLSTRAGKPMMVAEFEDMYDSCEVVLFPGYAYEQFSQHLFEDALVIIEGRLNKKNDEAKIICEKVIPLEKSHSEKVLNIELEVLDDSELLQNLRDILAQHKGRNRVILHTRKGKIEVGDKYRVMICDDISLKIGSLVGNSSVYETAIAAE